MTKNFNDFGGLTEDEIVEVLDYVANKLGLERSEETTTIPQNLFPAYSVVLNQAMTMKTLRKYHEWVNS